MSDTPRRKPRGTGKLNDMDQAVQGFIKHVLDIKATIPARTALALNYFAETCPYMVFPYNILFQAVMGFDRQPRIGSDDVIRFRAKLTAAGKILDEKYGRGKHSVLGVGVRATVDHDDRMLTTLPRRKAVARAGLVALSKEMASIDIKKVSNTPELKEHKAWFINNAKNILTESDDMMKRLLPPAKDK